MQHTKLQPLIHEILGMLEAEFIYINSYFCYLDLIILYHENWGDVWMTQAIAFAIYSADLLLTKNGRLAKIPWVVQTR